MDENGMVRLAVTLRDRDALEFERVQTELGLQQRTEVVRYLVRQEAQRMEDKRTKRVIDGWLLGKVTADEAMEVVAAEALLQR